MSISTTNVDRALSVEETQRIVAEFRREGFVVVPGVLADEECAALRERTDDLMQDFPDDNTFESLVLPGVAEKEPLFRNLLVREPILGLAKAILGDECRYCGSTVIRNDYGKAISLWHIDLGNAIEFPLPPEVPRHDPRIDMPVQWMTFQVALSDIDTIENGPTQFVPGSHYSGRLVPTQDNPEFEGRGPVSVLCKAGDVYLTNHQTWHRGAPNLSQRRRYILGLQYAMSWAVARFDRANIDAIVEALKSEGSFDEADPRLKHLLKVPMYS